MKAIVIFYSLDGNSAQVAEMLKSSLNAEILEIKTLDEKKRTGARKMFWGVGQVMFKKKPALKPYSLEINAWDLIILGTPVWAGSPAPAMISFLDKEKISGKKIALFCCHAGGMGEALKKFQALLPGNTVIGEIDFFNPAKAEKTEVKQKVDEWAKTLGA